MGEQEPGPVVIGMDPHKRTVTIEVMTPTEQVVGHGRFTTDEAGLPRCWSTLGVGLSGRGRSRVAKGSGGTSWPGCCRWPSQVVDVPAKLSARMRIFATGQGRKTDDTDAHSIALVGVRMAGLRSVVHDEQLEVLRLLVDRRRRIGEDHTRVVCQLHALLLEIVPGGAKKDLSAAQARKILAGVRPRDVVGKTRKRVALEMGADLEKTYRRKRRTRSSPSSWPRPAPACSDFMASVPQALPGCWSRLVTSPGSRPRGTSRPGPGPRRWTPPPATTCTNDSSAAGTGTSTRCCTSWPPCSCAPGPPKDGPTTTGRSPPARRPTRRCAAGNDACPSSSTGPCSTDIITAAGTGQGGHRGASLSSSAAGSQPHTETLRISHFPDPSPTNIEPPS